MVFVKSLIRFKLNEKILGTMLGIFSLMLLIWSQLYQPHSSKYVFQPIAPPPMIEHFSFGFNEVLADTLWIRAIQDFDYCDQEIAKHQCIQDSWLYRMLDAVTDLSPHFRMAYAAGGLALTVIISDIPGATKIFEKGVQQFPHDWPLLYRAAYQYLYEVKDKKRAAELLIQAGENGAPPWVFSLAGRLYSDSGELELAEKLLQEMKDAQQSELLIQRLEDKIASIKKQKQ